MIYEYKCNDCGAVLEVRATLAEKERGLRVKCQACGSTKTTQVFTTLNMFTRSGSSGPPPGFCGPGIGGGCC